MKAKVKELPSLCGSPDFYLTESPCSWVSRLSLCQGESLRKMSLYLEINNVKDLDFQIRNLDIKKIATLAGISILNFKVSRTIFKSLASFDKNGRSHLLFFKNKPRYRFCPVCLENDENPYFRLEWRFKAWQVCPLHECFLEEKCSCCQTQIILPLDMMRGGERKEGIGTLANCFKCGYRISRVMPTYIKDSKTHLTNEELKLIANGRALLSLLYNGHFQIRGVKKNYTIHEYALFNKKDIFKFEKT